MRYVTGLAVAVMAGLSLASAADAAELQNVSVELSSNYTSQATTLTINYRTVTSLDPHLMLAHIRMAGIVLTNGPCSNGGVTIKLDNVAIPLSDLSHCSLFSAEALQINTRSGLTIPANTLVTLIIDSSRFQTGPTAGTHSFTVFGTANTLGNIIDGKTPKPSITLVTPSVPTLGEWAMILFGSVLAGAGALWIARRKALLA